MGTDGPETLLPSRQMPVFTAWCARTSHVLVPYPRGSLPSAAACTMSRLGSGRLRWAWCNLARPLSPPCPLDDKQVLQNLKRILAKVQEMRDQRMSLEQQLREMIQKDDITTSLVTTDRSEMKVGASRRVWGRRFVCHTSRSGLQQELCPVPGYPGASPATCDPSNPPLSRQKLFEEQLKKYDQIKVYLEQNLAAQENVLKALTDANVKYAAVRKALGEVEHK